MDCIFRQHEHHFPHFTDEETGIQRREVALRPGCRRGKGPTVSKEFL